MGTITISIADDTEDLFRDVVREEVGTGKGTLGSAVEEALQLWIATKKQEEIAVRQIQWMKKGFHLGKYTFDRDELHERK